MTMFIARRGSLFIHRALRFNSTVNGSVSQIAETAINSSESIAQSLTLYSQLRSEYLCKWYTVPGLFENIYCGLHYQGVPWTATVALAGAALPILSQLLFKRFSSELESKKSLLDNADLFMTTNKMYKDCREPEKAIKFQRNVKNKRLIEEMQAKGLAWASQKPYFFAAADSLGLLICVNSCSMFSSSSLMVESAGFLSHGPPILLWATPIIYLSYRFAKTRAASFDQCAPAITFSKYSNFIVAPLVLYYFSSLAVNTASALFASSFVLTHYVTEKVVSKKFGKIPEFAKFYGGFIRRPTRLEMFRVALKSVK